MADQPKKRFTIYEREIMALLKAGDDIGGKVVMAVLRTMFGDAQPELDGLEEVLYDVVLGHAIQVMETSMKRAESRNGKTGGAPKGNQNARKPPVDAIAATDDEIDSSYIRPMRVKPNLKQAFLNQFDEFWKHYPKKHAKGDAEAEWTRVDYSKYRAFDIIEAIKKQAKWAIWEEDQIRYAPTADKWLKGRRWEDEETPSQAPKQEKFFVPEDDYT